MKNTSLYKGAQVDNDEISNQQLLKEHQDYWLEIVKLEGVVDTLKGEVDSLKEENKHLGEENEHLRAEN